MSEKRTDEQDVTLNPADETFARAAGDRLRQSADELDAATLSRLNRARQRALEELPGTARATPGWWLPAGATAVAAILVIGIWRAGGPDADGPMRSIEAVPVSADEAADFDLLLDAGELEMLEDLEFFAWLATEELESPG